ncbi:hypothetical protein HCU74_13870 [Spongiibacter sp. KMU-166]|uniref:Cysteine dioxygenase type I n=1 Tax=Spongiibacter thalassae TaxID=2721624 RepID=A0ABX1GH08_9GAMM|nr:hypothetical protein [Spongiibacter thalassae]NKI18499.1 hypothetical protein [Spongiibacter thalassae]
MKLPDFLLKRLQQHAASVQARPPVKVIGDNYLSRWHILPKNRLFNIYLHHVCGDDPDMNLHDHPWLFNLSIVLRGDIEETLPTRQRLLQEGSLTARMSRAPHRLALRSPDSLTLFITGPKIRDWGFYTDNGWVPSSRYLSADGNGRSVNASYGKAVDSR